MCVLFAKCGEKVLHDGNSVIKVFTCLYRTSIMRLNRNTPHVLIRFVFTSIYDFSQIKVIKISVYMVDS